jgi:hypothetical protein
MFDVRCFPLLGFGAFRWVDSPALANGFHSHFRAFSQRRQAASYGDIFSSRAIYRTPPAKNLLPGSLSSPGAQKIHF